MSWQPHASLNSLQQRAALYQHLREFFQQRDVLEVDVPILSQYATVDPFIDSLTTSVLGQTCYLQTSPEFFLKRLLVAYSQDIYYLGKAFRQGEKGRKHQPEFTMLEWYRIGWDERQLMEEVQTLLCGLFPQASCGSLSYRDVFMQVLDINPHSATLADLQGAIQQHIDVSLMPEDISGCLDLLFTHCVEPQLPAGVVSLYDYPACQAALARIDHNAHGESIARRFEVYLDGVELANGYWELNDGDEQERRFKADQHYRQQHQLTDVPYDQHLIDAMTKSTLPNCAGVALGVDRLLMKLLGYQDIREVISFT